MKAPPSAPDEASRLATLRDYRLLDTLPDPRLDELTSLAATICGVPIALISLVDEHRQWFKSCIGIEVEELDRETSFCGHAILSDDLFVVEDTSKDERFVDNPLVTGDPRIGFYTGMPLISPNGSALGTLCVIDHTPRQMNESQRQTLRVLARQVVAQFELRRRSAQIESEKYRMDQALEASRMGHYEWDLRDGGIRRWSGVHEELWGYAPGEYDGSLEGFVGRIHPDDMPAVNAVMVDGSSSRDFHSTEYRVIRPDGTERWIEGRGKFYRDESGQVVSMRGVVIDVTERKQDEMDLAEARVGLEQAQKISHTGSWEYHTSNGAIKWSDELYRIFGLLPQSEEITYERLLTFVHSEDRADLDVRFEKIRAMAPGDRVDASEFRIVREDGVPGRVRVDAELAFDDAGRVVEIFGTVRDITKEREAENLLRIKDFAIHSTATGMCFTDLEGNLTDANAAALSIWGYERLDELQGGPISHLSSGPEKLLEIREAILTRGYWSGEDLVRRRDGSRVMVESTSGMIKDNSGRPIGMMATFIDITEKKAAESALQAQEEQLRLFIEHNPAAIAMFDHDMVYLQASDRWMKAQRRDKPSVIGRCHYDIFPEVSTKWREVHQRCLQGAEEYCAEESMERADGCIDWISWEVRPWTRTDGSIGGIIIYSEDITIRKAAEAAIYQSQRRLREMIDGIGPSIYVALLDRTGTILEVGNSGVQASGQKLDDLLGHRIDETAPWVEFADEQRELRRRLDIAAEGKSSRYEVRLKMAGGELLDLDFSIEPLRDESGEVTFLVASAVNVTERKAAEAKTRYQEGILQETGRIAKVGGWEFDPATGEGTWTDEVARIHDLPPSNSTKAADGFKYYTEESRPRIEAAVRDVIEKRQGYDLELEMVSAKGVKKWVRTIGRPVVEGGKLVKVRGSFQDVTGRKQAEDRIQQLNRIYSVLSEVNQTIVREKDPSKMLRKACQIAVDHGGFKMAWIGLKEDSVGPLRIEAHAGASPETAAWVALYLEKGQGGCIFTYRAATTAEHGICNDITNDPEADDWRAAALARGYRSMASLPLNIGGVAVGTFNLYAPEEGFFDEEEMRLLDELALDISFALDVSRRDIQRVHFGSVMEASLNEIYIFDVDTLRFRFMNAGARTNLGCGQNQVTELTPLNIKPEYDEATFRSLIAPLISAKKSELVFITVHRRMDGSEYPVEVHLQLVEQAGDRVFLAIVLDLSERVKAESDLRESEEKLSQAVTMAELGHWEYDVADGLFTFNDHFYSLLRTTAEAQGGYRISLANYVRRFRHLGDATTMEAEIAKASATKDPEYSSSQEIRVVRADGEIGVFVVRAFVEQDENGRTIKVNGINQNITKRRQAEEAVLQVERRYRAIIEHSADGVALLDGDGKLNYISPSVEKIDGFSAEESLTRSGLQGIHPEDLPKMKAIFDEMFARPGIPFPLLARREHKNGHWIWIEGVGTNLLDDPTVGAIVINFRDITERLSLEEEYRQSQKMDAVGQLAGGVAHDFNNIIAAIIMQSEIANRSLGDAEKVRKMLLEIRKTAKQAADLTRQLLTFSRRQVMQLKQLELNEVVTEITQMLQRVLTEAVHVHLDLHPGTLFTRADQGMLDQVLMNLVINARDAMPEGGKLVIATGEKELTAEQHEMYPEAATGHYVVLRVSDTGTGITPENLTRIFEPFFTTKDESKGTGLGLATVFGIVKQHGGTIRVESEIGRGTTFEILLVADKAGEVVAPKIEPENEPESGNETILLVEDDPNLRMLTEMILSESGYHVLEAKSGPDALKVWAEKGDSVHLLLSDMVMPDGMTGQELGEKLLQDNPNLKIVFTSGYSVALAGRELELKSGQAFAQKPCAPDKLLSMIRRLLDE